MNREFVLRIACDDRPGIVARVSTFLAGRDCNILDAQQFEDRFGRRFFMRVVFDPAANEIEALRASFGPIADELGMEWALRDSAVAPRVLIMVSKFDHCLVDLLYRERIGEIAMDIAGVISNHPLERERLPMAQDVPFHYLPVTQETKAEQEASVREIIEQTGAELVVLARYMQILSDGMARFLAGRCINIHHSFLPSFKGARPYHQAYERGVKMIGATSHYVTADLDEGPIIAQHAEPISHRDTPDDLVAKGRDVERRVLARAVKMHVEGRVFLNGQRTVVFAD